MGSLLFSPHPNRQRSTSVEKDGGHQEEDAGDEGGKG